MNPVYKQEIITCSKFAAHVIRGSQPSGGNYWAACVYVFMKLFSTILPRCTGRQKLWNCKSRYKANVLYCLLHNLGRLAAVFSRISCCVVFAVVFESVCLFHPFPMFLFFFPNSF